MELTISQTQLGKIVDKLTEEATMHLQDARKYSGKDDATYTAKIAASDVLASLARALLEATR